MRSMTGFGRYIMEDSGLTQQWEIRSVNGKRLELKWSLPAAVRNMESRFEKIVKRRASRGRVDITLSLQFASGLFAPHFDAAQASGMLDALAALAESREENFTPDYNALLALALDDWNEARQTEGEALSRDLMARVLRMEEWTELIRERAPIIKKDRTEALHERINEELASLNCGEIEESRFLQEVVTLMDRLDVTEEITRLSTHLEHLRELLQEESDVGRRLDFTLQECFREINTCGNKIPDVQLSRLVVDYKNELEKCREQVQNLE